MKDFPLDLESLSPRESELVLSTQKDPIVLKVWSLRVRAWAFDKWGPAKLQEIFSKQQILPISEMAYFMLKDKDRFKTLEEFQEAICTVQDQVNLSKALLASVGIGEPEIEKINTMIEKDKSKAAVDPNARGPKRKK